MAKLTLEVAETQLTKAEIRSKIKWMLQNGFSVTYNGEPVKSWSELEPQLPKPAK